MKITALTVCVNYAQYLERSLQTWFPGLNGLIVVTSPNDTETKDLCKSQGITYMVTEAFYAKGAVFNKGAAMSEVIKDVKNFQKFFTNPTPQFEVPLSTEEFNKLQFFKEWCLFIDADISLPENWKQKIIDANPSPGNLYGASRVLEDGNGVPDEELAGFFQMFHARDHNAQRNPFLDVTWKHAGGYDSEFMMRWKDHHKKFLPLCVTHQGETGKNWLGIGNEQAMIEMMENRARLGAIGKDERIRK